MPAASPCAYRRWRTSLVVLAAMAGAGPMTPDAPPADWTRIDTGGGLVVIGLAAPGPVTVEAWLGGGADDEATGPDPDRDGLAHLAEHIALAQARAPQLDGRVTPSATLLRATAPDLDRALAPVWAAMTADRVDPHVLAREQRAIAAETTTTDRDARLGANLWRRVMRGPARPRGRRAAEQVGAGQVAAGQVAVGQVAVGQVAAGQVAAGQVGAGQVAAGQVAVGQVAAGQVAVGQVAAGQVAAGQVVAGQVVAGQVGAEQVVAGQVAAGQVAAGQVAAGQVAVGQVAAGHVPAASGTAAQQAAAVESWWATQWRAHPATLVIYGGFTPTALDHLARTAIRDWSQRSPASTARVAATSQPSVAQSNNTEPSVAQSNVTEPSAAQPSTCSTTTAAWVRPAFAADAIVNDDGLPTLGLVVDGVVTPAGPIVAVAVAAARLAGTRIELLGGAPRSIVAVSPDAPLAWPARDDHRRWTAARAAAMPLALPGVFGVVGAVAAGQHLAGDPTWATRHRAAVAVTTADEAIDLLRALEQRRHRLAASARASGAGQINGTSGSAERNRGAGPGAGAAPGQAHTHDHIYVRGGRGGVQGDGLAMRATRQARPISLPRRQRSPQRAATAHGTRLVVAVEAGAPMVAIRVAWPGGLAAEPVAMAGRHALAAVAITDCADAAIVDALGGSLAVVIERERFGLRVEVPAAAWRDGLAAIAACARAPAPAPARLGDAHRQLGAVAATAARSATGQALAAFARARFGDHPLARELAATAIVPALPGEVARWLADRYPLTRAVIAVVGAVEPAAVAAALDALLADAPPVAVLVDESIVDPQSPRAATPRGRAGGTAVRPAPAGATASGTAQAAPDGIATQLFVDRFDDASAVVIGHVALAAGDPDRAALDVLAAILDDPRGPLAGLAAVAAARRVAVADTADAGYLAVALDQPHDRAAAVSAAEAALTGVAAQPPTPATVAAARERLLARRLAPPHGARVWADDLAIAELTGGPDRRTALAAVDAEAVARVARRVLGSPATIVTVRPPTSTPGVERHRAQPLSRRAARRPRRRSP